LLSSAIIQSPEYRIARFTPNARLYMTVRIPAEAIPARQSCWGCSTLLVEEFQWVLSIEIKDDLEALYICVDDESRVDEDLLFPIWIAGKDHLPLGFCQYEAGVELNFVEAGQGGESTSETVKQLFALRQCKCKIAAPDALGALWADSNEDVGELADYRGNITGLAVEFKGLKESFN